jgi:hypothetical protein
MSIKTAPPELLGESGGGEGAKEEMGCGLFWRWMLVFVRN